MASIKKIDTLFICESSLDEEFNLLKKQSDIITKRLHVLETQKGLLTLINLLKLSSPQKLDTGLSKGRLSVKTFISAFTANAFFPTFCVNDHNVGTCGEFNNIYLKSTTHLERENNSSALSIIELKALIMLLFPELTTAQVTTIQRKIFSILVKSRFRKRLLVIGGSPEVTAAIVKKKLFTFPKGPPRALHIQGLILKPELQNFIIAHLPKIV